MYILNESVVQPLMDAADLTDDGRKVFCQTDENGKVGINKLSYILTDALQLDTSVSAILHTRSQKGVNSPIKPVFASVTADNGFVGVYWKENVNKISTGYNWMLYHKFINILLSEYNPIIELNNDKSIKAISLHLGNKLSAMDNLNNFKYKLNLM